MTSVHGDRAIGWTRLAAEGNVAKGTLRSRLSGGHASAVPAGSLSVFVGRATTFGRAEVMLS